MRIHSTANKSDLSPNKPFFRLRKLNLSLLRLPELPSWGKSSLLAAKAIHIHPLRTLYKINLKINTDLVTLKI